MYKFEEVILYDANGQHPLHDIPIQKVVNGAEGYLKWTIPAHLLHYFDDKHGKVPFSTSRNRHLHEACLERVDVSRQRAIKGSLLQIKEGATDKFVEKPFGSTEEDPVTLILFTGLMVVVWTLVITKQWFH